VHGVHKGHDVLNVNKAHQQLTGKISEALATSQARLDEFAADSQTLERLRQDLQQTVGSGRRKLREALEQLSATLAKKEAELLAASQTWERATDEAVEKVANPAKQRAHELQELQGMFRNCSDTSNELEGVRSLNVYAAARERTEKLLQPMLGLEGGVLSQIINDAAEQLGCNYTQEAELLDGIHRLASALCIDIGESAATEPLQGHTTVGQRR